MSEDYSTTDVATKQCTRCLKDFPATSIHFPECRSRFGVKYLRGACKECSNAKHRENESRHIEEVRLRKKQRYLSNKEDVLAKSKAWRLANLEHARKKGRERAARNKASQRERYKKWKKNNPGKESEHTQRKRAAKLSTTINPLTSKQWEIIKAHYFYRCVYCDKNCSQCKNRTHKLTQDHITPLSKGGKHSMDNVVPACLICNCKKRAGPPPCPVQPLLL